MCREQKCCARAARLAVGPSSPRESLRDVVRGLEQSRFVAPTGLVGNLHNGMRSGQGTKVCREQKCCARECSEYLIAISVQFDVPSLAKAIGPKVTDSKQLVIDKDDEDLLFLIATTGRRRRRRRKRIVLLC